MYLGRKAERQREAQERQVRWDNLNTAEKLQQKIEQSNGDTTEAEILRMRLSEEMNGP